MKGPASNISTHPPVQLAGLGALAVLAVVLRWSTHSTVVYNWDSVHYVLALDRYDILAHQPHPPGSYYYILIARVARALWGDPHQSLLLVSALSGAGYVLVLYSLVRALGGERSAWLGAVLGATAPLFWFYGSVGLNYGPAGVLSAATALGCVLVCRSNSRGGLLFAAASLGLLGGVRPTDLVFLLPAYLWASGIWFVRMRKLSAGNEWGIPTGGMLILIGLTLGWLIPNILTSGGLAPYLGSIRGQEHLLDRSSVLASGWPAFQEARITHQRSLESALGAAWIGVALAFAAMLTRRFRPVSTASHSTDRVLNTLGCLIIAPAFLFYLLGHFNSPGYALTYASYLGAVLILKIGRELGLEVSGSLLSVASRRLWMAAVVGGVALNVWLFIAGWPGWGPLAQRSLSFREIRDHADYYIALRRFLQAHHPPGTVRLLASWNSTDGLRTAQFLLPDYHIDIAQAVAEMPKLPPAFESLTFLRMITPARILKEGRPTYAIVRTWEDPPYHMALFGRDLQRVPLGSGHFLYRVELSNR